MNCLNLKTEYAETPLGIDTPNPRLSWLLESEEDGQVQTAYQVLVATDKERLNRDEGDLWDSGKVISDQSVNVVYEGRPLESKRVCYWKVRAWDKYGNISPWSQTAYWSMGLLDRKEWKGRWIGRKKIDRKKPDHQELLPSPYFRKEIRIDKEIRRAFLYATALGVYELYLNGERVGGDYLAPGWTDYNKRVQYQTYDVTTYLCKGRAAIGAIAGTGWYAGHVGMFGQEIYGDNPYLLVELHIEYEDGTGCKVITDESWKTSAGPILYSDFLKGESFDARLEPAGWNRPGYDDSGWEAPVLLDRYEGLLVAQVDPPIQVMKELLPVSMTKTARGTYLFDMGQNIVGWVRLQVEESQEGQEISVQCAEMLNIDGTLYLDNLRKAIQCETYILRGGGRERLEPHFTFHGFRYVEVTGLRESATLQTVIGRVVHSATPPTGTLETSDVMVNKLFENITWGQRGNFLSVPTDCPQRDERLGWLGDAQIFARTACYNMDVAQFFTKYMTDIMDAQQPSGAFPDIAPDSGWNEFKRNSQSLNWQAPENGGWGDAGVIIPWTVYEFYGDKRILEQCYPAMVKWVDYLKENSPGLIRPGHSNYGDWLSIHEDTPKDVLDTAYFAYSTDLLSKSAKALGKEKDELAYRRLFTQIKQAFTKAFVGSDGRIKGDTQSVYVLALKMNLLPDKYRRHAIRHLTDNIARNGGHLTTGFLGVGYLLPALTEAGRLDIAYRLLNQTTFPSWLYSVRHGATTIWERWDGWTEEKGFQDPGMNSFNHYSLGSVGEWMFQYILGIRPDEEYPGFKHVVIRPQPGGGLSYARGQFHSVHGTIGVAWKREISRLELEISVPVNTTATVYVPGEAAAAECRSSDDLKVLSADREGTVYKAGSGKYSFTSKWVEPSQVGIQL